MTPPVRLAAVALWVLVAAGPLLGALALVRPAASGSPGVPEGPPSAVAGVAELTVHAHLTAPPGEVPPHLAPAHPALRPAGSVLEGLGTESREAAAAATSIAVDAVATIHTAAAGPGRWGVTVGVLRAGRLEAWQVTVAEHDRGAVPETLPARVALPDAPPPATPAVSALRSPDRDDPLATAIQRFLEALLGGQGELQRYVAAGSELTAPTPPARTVELRRLASGPVGDRHLAVLAEVRTTAADGAVQVQHHPLLAQRSDGRWEVQRLLPALPVQPTRPDPDTATTDEETSS